MHCGVCYTRGNGKGWCAYLLSEKLTLSLPGQRALVLTQVSHSGYKVQKEILCMWVSSGFCVILDFATGGLRNKTVTSLDKDAVGEGNQFFFYSSRFFAVIRRQINRRKTNWSLIYRYFLYPWDRPRKIDQLLKMGQYHLLLKTKKIFRDWGVSYGTWPGKAQQTRVWPLCIARSLPSPLACF